MTRRSSPEAYQRPLSVHRVSIDWAISPSWIKLSDNQDLLSGLTAPIRRSFNTQTHEKPSITWNPQTPVDFSVPGFPTSIFKLVLHGQIRPKITHKTKHMAMNNETSSNMS
ncbi:hypothetical protein VTJ04DRAFT_6922 [Mycothermus thermophilus]|uniref:uncharacterized protein n=1 Tax=Humicola insolens TaxID=85995 RepID=UPI003743E2FD